MEDTVQVNELEELNKNKKMSEVQNHILDMTKQLVKILDSNHIKYYMIGGTLLGAIRHKGFIPWDDDIDIGVPRHDYDRFLEIADKVLPPSLKLRTYYDESEHHYYFARVVDSRYHILRQGSLKEREEELWVDLFPLDGLPRNKLIRGIHKARLLFWKGMYHFATFEKVNLQRPNIPKWQRLIIKGYMIWPFKSKKGYKKYLDKIDKILKSAPIEKSDYLTEFMASMVPFRETCTVEQYGEGKMYDFEDIQLRGPSDAEFYLSHVVGDYMKLPPKEKRNYHASKFIELPEG